MDQDATSTEVNLGLGDVVLDGVASPALKGAQPLQLSAHVYCDQMAGWMKTPLDTEVDLGPGHIVLDGHRAPPTQKGHSSPPVLVHVYCGHSCPSQLLLGSC